GWKERDARGRVVAVSEPFYWDSAALPTARPATASVQTVGYDALDRVVVQTLATGARSAKSYGAFCSTATTDALAPVTSCADGLGRVIHTERVAAGVLERADASYDAADRMIA